MGETNFINNFFAVLYLLILAFGLSISYEAVSTITNENEDFGEAIGEIFAFGILLIFWWGAQILALIFALPAKITKQGGLILSIALIEVLGNIAIMPGYLIYWGRDHFVMEDLPGIAIIFSPLILHLLLVLRGFQNR